MIAIVGAGWYGLYMAYVLQKQGIPYIVYEKSDRIFNGESFRNQNRLHQGFHYPRSYETRMQSIRGFKKFLEVFGSVTTEVKENIYAVPYDSIIDFRTCLQIFEASELEFETIKHESLPDDIFEGAIRVDERFIDPLLARDYFRSLNLSIQFDSEISVVDEKVLLDGLKIDFDLLFDCTYGTLMKDDTYFERFFLTHVIKLDDSLMFDALTVIDGPFFSIYPFTSSLHTLTHVKFGIINDENVPSEPGKNFEATISDAEQYLPGISNKIETIDSFTSRKYLPISGSAYRGTSIRKHNNKFYSVLGGKIDTIFEIDDLLLKLGIL
ncbi:NAD(P)/FAD-dependent oxidoreductase [Candidatus Marinimicrobia bacterium MT.SAG.2]|nr:NAD(P)/FAD-dependent oxidoreductase [Candidatus Marinimicrobia bacterium MT.SAG.2]